jgi:adenylyltransferase/sulfurtransferase
MGDRDRRHERQVRFAELGPERQARLAAGRVTIVGCGATGGTMALLLARAGVGFLRLCDHDRVELSNLHRQLLYTEAHLGHPKAAIAAQVLAAIDSGIELDPRVVAVDRDTVGELITGVDLVLDGSDSFATRCILNEACVAAGLPWIHVGAVGATGQTLTIRPGEGPCLACLIPEPPPASAAPGADVLGVLGPAPVAIGSLGAAAALRVLSGAPDPTAGRLVTLDVWNGRAASLPVRRRPDCAVCGGR